MQESPIIVSDSVRKAQAAEVDKRKVLFDKALAVLCLEHGMVPMPLVQYGERGMLAVLDIRPMTDGERSAMSGRIAASE